MTGVSGTIGVPGVLAPGVEMTGVEVPGVEMTGVDAPGEPPGVTPGDVPGVAGMTTTLDGPGLSEPALGSSRGVEVINRASLIR